MAKFACEGPLVFVPARNMLQTLYVLDMSQTLFRRLSDAAPPKGLGPVMHSLALDIASNLDHVVSVRTVEAGECGRDWIVATRPIDLRTLVLIVARWTDRSGAGEACGEVRAQDLAHDFQTPRFSNRERSFEIRLLDDGARPVGDWAPKAICLRFADAIAERSMALSGGRTCVFSLAHDLREDGCTLVSTREDAEPRPWSIRIRLWLDTPTGDGAARVMVDVGVTGRDGSPVLERGWHHETPGGAPLAPPAGGTFADDVAEVRAEVARAVSHLIEPKRPRMP